MMTIPRKSYRLRDGTNGTEYDAGMEALKLMLNQQQMLEDRIEEMRRKLLTAEGHPNV